MIITLVPAGGQTQAPAILTQAPTVPGAHHTTNDRLDPEVMRKLSPYRAPHVRDWMLHVCVSPWHPLPPSDEEIEALWIQFPNMARPIPDYVAIRDTFFNLVHSGHVEVINGDIHSCINMCILPDWILNDNTALLVLQLK
jgi:hypothetical protein